MTPSTKRPRSFLFALTGLIKKAIEFLFWKYCAEEILQEQELEEQEFEVVFEPDPELEEIVSFETELISLFAPTEIEKAMYEKQFFTLH